MNMKKIYFCFSLCYIFVFSVLSAENINFTAEHTSLLSKLKTKDIQHFQKRWKTANETQKQRIIKQQREIFNVLFQQLNDSSMPTADEVELLAKVTRLSPIFAPYQIRMLNFIKNKNIQSRKEYFDILCKYIPNVSADETFYTIQEGNKSHIIYNTDVLRCIFIAESVKTQLAADNYKSNTSKLNAINGFIERLNSLNIIISELKLSINKNSFELTIHTEKPYSEIRLKDDNITITIKEIE